MTRGTQVVLVACLMAGLIAAWTSRPAIAERAQALVPEQVRIESRIPRPETARLASLGHNEAVADLLWLNALGYFGQYIRLARETEAVDWLSPHIEAIIGVDPRFRMIYVWAGTVPFYDQGGRERVEISNRFLEQGLEVFPRDWQLNLMLGMNWLLDMQPEDADERLEFRRIAAEHFLRAAESPGAPGTVKVLASSEARRLGLEQLRLRGVQAQLMRAADHADARSIRAQVEQLAPRPEADAATALRQVAAQLQWNAGLRRERPALSMLLHPDPALAVRERHLVPAHLAHTQ